MAGLTGNSKDTGSVNVRVDFVWGNMPMQPDDDRGSNTVDQTLGNHSQMVVGWGAYPAATAGRGTQKTMPSLADNDTKAAVLTALKKVGWKESEVTWAYSGNAAGTTKYWNAYDNAAAPTPTEGSQTTAAGDGCTINLYNCAPTVALTSVTNTLLVATVNTGACVEGAKTDGTDAEEPWNVEFIRYEYDMGDSKAIVKRTGANATDDFTYTYAEAGTYTVKARGVVQQAATGMVKVGAWSAGTNVTVTAA